MALSNVGDIWQVIFDGRLAGQQVINTWYYKVTASGGGGIDHTVLDELIFDQLDTGGGMFESYVSAMSNQYAMQRKIIQLIHPIRYVSSQRSDGPATGLVSSAQESPAISAVLTLRTELAGRDQISNKHLPAVPLTYYEDGNITALGLAAYGNLGSAATVGLVCTDVAATVTLEPCIYHRAAPALSPVVTNFIIGSTVRVERRRTVGLGS